MDDCEWATDWPTNWEGEWPGEWDWSKEWPWAGDWAVLKEWASSCLASILKGPPVKSVSKAFEALPKPVLRFMKEVPETVQSLVKGSVCSVVHVCFANSRPTARRASFHLHHCVFVVGGSIYVQRWWAQSQGVFHGQQFWSFWYFCLSLPS